MDNNNNNAKKKQNQREERERKKVIKGKIKEGYQRGRENTSNKVIQNKLKASVIKRHLLTLTSSTTTVIRKRIKPSIIMACAEFAALDGRAFDTMSGTDFLNLAKQLVDAGRLLGNSSTVKIEYLMPHSTTVRNIYFVNYESSGRCHPSF